MSKEQIFLGRVKDEINGPLSGRELYLTKHEFYGGQSWLFGYMGKVEGVDTYFVELLLHVTTSDLSFNVYTASEIFTDPLYSDDDWWLVRDLFVQAYALQRAADVYKYGGRQCFAPESKIIRSDVLHNRINRDLEEVLDQIWTILTTRRLK